MTVFRLSKFLCICIAYLPFVTQAQQTKPAVSKFYMGVQAGTPLFWGDVFSMGVKKYPGIAVGATVGYRLSGWLGVGVWGAKSWQKEDYINQDGLRLAYVPGNWKLGEIYSRTVFTRAGLRVPVQALTLLRPVKNLMVDVV